MKEFGKRAKREYSEEIKTTASEATIHYKHAFLILRLGLGLLFFWFGIDKLIHPANWQQFIPSFLAFISNEMILLAQGIIETTLGLLLLAGKFIRIAAFFTAIIFALMIFMFFMQGNINGTIVHIALISLSMALLLASDTK